jgi:hypothetical protein
MINSLKTFFRCLSFGACGVSIKDKVLAFFIAGFGIIGRSRSSMRVFYGRQISRMGSDGLLTLTFRVNSLPTIVQFRRGNEGDYIVLGEMVRGSYSPPSGVPLSIIDCGANIGTFALSAIRQFPDAQIVCYEPDPTNFEILSRNLRLNGLNSDLKCMGVWSDQCTLYYHAQTAETGYVDRLPPGLPINCELPSIGCDCWLKLDVEGAEYEVLPALFELRAYPRWISLEIHHFLRSGDALLSLLRDHGYSLDRTPECPSDCEVIFAERVPSVQNKAP